MAREKNYELSDFKHKLGDMVKAHARTSSCIHKWTREGAFPHAMYGEIRVFPEEALRYTHGDIVRNISEGKYKEPLARFERGYKKVATIGTRDEILFNAIKKVECRLDRVEELMASIVTKLEEASDEYKN